MDATEVTAVLARARQGDSEAFRTLVERHSRRAFQLAYRITGNEQDAEDVVQESFIRAYRQLGRFEARAHFGTWLHRIVVNEALMRLRTRRRKPETSIDDLLPSYLEDGHHAEQFPDWSERADDLIEKEQARRTVRACIDQLPDNYREVLMLRDIEELSTEDAARLLSMTPTAVKVRLHRARQALSTLVRREFTSHAR